MNAATPALIYSVVRLLTDHVPTVINLDGAGYIPSSVQQSIIAPIQDTPLFQEMLIKDSDHERRESEKPALTSTQHVDIPTDSRHNGDDEKDI